MSIDPEVVKAQALARKKGFGKERGKGTERSVLGWFLKLTVSAHTSRTCWPYKNRQEV